MKLLKLFIAIVISGSMAASAFAHDGTINFMGRVVSGTCSAGPSASEVKLEDVAVASLSSKGKTAGDKPFEINLTNCGLVGAKTVKVKFDGLRTDDLLEVASSKDNAKNVGIGIYNSADNSQITHDGFSTPMNVSSDKAKFNFKAKYVSKGVATVGIVKASTTFTLHYN
ncbi:type 1 fimbrial protein [Xenorhabdus sp. Reich]|uniref:Type 1 fimbrial protein n=1 Tax=Xenorhabdus littoralis TaxID=2582835 RepID=A0ABU4SNR4_9GAMM|nr:fimbrial protein [Xenorhabdus sp. Reich]MDX8000250.1 type 1 fimbrial protein [Xenorhabdus sp. Reich]